MKITRNVILDLLPIYVAGEASADTRALMESYLASDPEAAELAKEFAQMQTAEDRARTAQQGGCNGSLQGSEATHVPAHRDYRGSDGIRISLRARIDIRRLARGLPARLVSLRPVAPASSAAGEIQGSAMGVFTLKSNCMFRMADTLAKNSNLCGDALRNGSLSDHEIPTISADCRECVAFESIGVRPQAIARHIGVDCKTVAKALRWILDGHWAIHHGRVHA